MLGRVARELFNRTSAVTWIVPDAVLACRYPRRVRDLEHIASLGVTLIVNLHERGHSSQLLGRIGLRELHLPVPDFTPPSLEQLQSGVTGITEAVAEGERVAIHCGAGLGRTGTLLACYLVSRGNTADAAIARVRNLRPGSIETSRQEQAVHAYASPRHDGETHASTT